MTEPNQLEANTDSNHPVLGFLPLACLLVVGVLSTGCTSISTTSFTLTDPDSVTKGLGAAEVAANNYVLDETGQAIELHVTDQSPTHLPPSELNKVSLPRYRIEPPDVLFIQAVRMAPKSPYYIQSLDILMIVATGALPEEPIAGQFQVEPNGTVNLGPSYGAIKIIGLSTQEATDTIEEHLQRQGSLADPQVAVSLLQASGQQAIFGEHLVAPDGYINLGKFGGVYVAGMTVDEARATIERKLSETLDNPVISLSVFAYNSKVYYIIMAGAGFGDNVFRIPITGNETVLDALAQIQGVQRISNTKKMWISRPAPHDSACQQILPIDWDAITMGASTATNYQLLPGDRVYIGQDRMVAFEQLVIKLTAPIERMFGFSLLGAQTIQTLQRFPEGFRTGGF